VGAFRDSKMVQQISGESQCLDDMMNNYHDQCLNTYAGSASNGRVNSLAQQASHYRKIVFICWSKLINISYIRRLTNEYADKRNSYLKLFVGSM
jgi:hypothetical protein